MCVTKNLTKNPWGGVFVCEALIFQTVNRRDSGYYASTVTSGEYLLGLGARG